MKRVLAGAGVLALLGLGMTPSAAGAQGAPPPVTETALHATASPTPATPGADLTITPTEGCKLFDPEHNAPGELVVWLGPVDDTPDLTVPLDDKGMWTVTLKAPTQPGTYVFHGDCHPAQWWEEWQYCHGKGPEAGGGQGRSVKALKAPLWGDGDCVFESYEVTITVPSPTPPPATPIPQPPNQTG